KISAYIIMVWMEWVSFTVTSVFSWLFLYNSHVGPRCPQTFVADRLLFVQIQCLMQIMTNRIGLILYNPDKARRLKVAISIATSIINVSVFIIWIPARLQISPTWIRVNDIWDRTEKSIYLIIDFGLKSYFMYLLKSKLVANGLTKYNLVYRFNLSMVFLSISLDVIIIGIMSLPDDEVYIQVHPLAYIIKLYIEMNIAELLGKALKKSN
ncbi:hypothetical protein B0T17DRAFT_478078, partial [Bombardia bombarda]